MNLDDYLSRPNCESMAAFARDLGLNTDQVRQWRHGTDGRRPSPENCAVMERHSSGLMTCEDLRPDLEWHRVTDKAWPWHRKGRPVLDVAKAVA
ncbi:MAG: YdaS family helix-turn-helix protein [Burkholderiaceae bacterium]|nr:YdaS family helix-turn-helix protein [Burkholderiaceae bacterium]